MPQSLSRSLDPSDAERQRRLIESLNALYATETIDLRTYEHLRQRAESVKLPLDQICVNRWFAELCQHESGEDYSRSQRSVFVTELNTVLLKWHDEGLVENRLKVKNYSRTNEFGTQHITAQ